MKTFVKAALLTSIATFSATSIANDLEGEIEAVDQGAQSFKVQGIEFLVSESTDYDDGVSNFSELKAGQRVEVDFEYRDKKHYATEIELDD